jgi:hypothetical protein
MIKLSRVTFLIFLISFGSHADSKPLDHLYGSYEGDVVDANHLGFRPKEGARCLVEIKESTSQKYVEYAVRVKETSDIDEDIDEENNNSTKIKLAIDGAILKSTLKTSQEDYLNGEDSFTCGDSKFLCATELPISPRRDSMSLQFDQIGTEYYLASFMAMKGLTIDLWTFGHIECQNMIKVTTD